MSAIRCALLFAMLAASSGCFSEGTGGSGQVLDWSTHEPIAGARVVLFCQGRPPWPQPEGSVLIRKVTRTTDAAGRYAFSSADEAGCWYVFTGAAKAGYGLADSNLQNEGMTLAIPSIEYLVKDSDMVWFELQRITPSPTSAMMQPNGTFSAPGTYMSVFTPFFEAKRIATTPRELAFVHEHYCARLQRLHAELTDADMAYVARFAVSYSFRGKFGGARTMDYAEVSTYCGTP